MTKDQLKPEINNMLLGKVAKGQLKLTVEKRVQCAGQRVQTAAKRLSLKPRSLRTSWVGIQKSQLSGMNESQLQTHRGAGGGAGGGETLTLQQHKHLHPHISFNLSLNQIFNLSEGFQRVFLYKINILFMIRFIDLTD